jgi:4a-hydroxytetrahydrobiopterin dehydratase
MNQLTNKTCVACKVGAPLATEDEINEFKQQLPNWIIIEKDGIF